MKRFRVDLANPFNRSRASILVDAGTEEDASDKAVAASILKGATSTFWRVVSVDQVATAHGAQTPTKG